MQAIIKRLKCDKRGVSNVIVVMLSLVLIVIIVGNVILWSYQMNQLDLERMQEAVTVSDVSRVTSSPWFTAGNEYSVNVGTRLNGTYVDTQAVDSNPETFREEITSTNYVFNPSGYLLGGTTKYISGAVSDLTTDNSAYMVFRSYPSATSAKTLYAHQEQTIVGGRVSHFLNLSFADATGTTLSADAQNEGRLFMGRFVYQLTGVQSIPASTWTVYYRAQKTISFITAHCDIDILIRTSAGAVRSTIATDVAGSADLSTSWSTLSGTYSWANYTVVDQTDYLEIIFYMHVTTKKNNEYVQLRIDDNTLAVTDQTRIAGVILPSTYTVQIELTGSSNTQNWQSLTWIVNSAFTTAIVNTTLQLYNFYTSQYPTNGDGYIAYTSNPTPNTDETINQTIVANPTYYRNSTGAWKIRITGVKDTTSPFDLKLDWVEFKGTETGIYRLNITNSYTVDLQIYPIVYTRSIDILLRYNVSNSDEKWFLKAYNWTAAGFSDIGFNDTGGNQPTLGQWNEYAISITNNLKDYIAENGTILLEFFDEGTGANQTPVEVDFLGVRAMIDGTRINVKNSSPLTVRVVAIWIVNSTNHQRYDANLFMNSGEEATYIRADISLPEDGYIARVVTERGNIAVFAGS